MLKELTVKNFMSFKDETVFTMEADSDRVSEHLEHVVSICDNQLLKAASFYGPNGGGKTNLLKALNFLKVVQKGMLTSFDPVDYVCVYTESKRIEQTVFFVDEKYEIGYKYVIIPERNEKEAAIEDTEDGFKEHIRLNVTSLKIESEEIVFKKANTEKYETLISRSNNGSLKTSYFNGLIPFDKFKLAKTKSVIRYFFDTFANRDNFLPEDLDVIRHLMEQIQSIVVLDSNRSTKNIIKIVKEHKEELISALNNVDIRIQGIKVYENRINPIYFVRQIAKDDNVIAKEIPLNMESKGTQKVFHLFLSIIEGIKEKEIFLCDDMNAFLHPKLYREVVELFQKNNYQSQLVFNSHDIINMDNELFRRDEIWFAYRDDEYGTKLVPLSNIVNYKGDQIRKDAKYYKQYLEGRYGADPFIKRGLNWNE